MGKDLTMVALDSNAMTYWIEAMSSTTGPPGEPCGAEKVALARIYFCRPEESGYHLTPTVQQEYEAIKVQKKLEDHVSWRMVHISPVMPLPEAATVQSRVDELRPFYKGENDRRIVAEC